MKIKIAYTVVLVLILLGAVSFYISRNLEKPTESMNKNELVSTVEASYQNLYNEIKKYESVSIGKPIVVANDIVGGNESVCVEVTLGNLQPNFYAKLHLWKDHLYGQFCDIDKEMKPFPDTDFFGYAEADYSIIDLKTGSIDKLEPEGWSFISSGAFCASGLAYWGLYPLETGESQIFVTIFDLDKQTIVSKKELPTRLIATDFPGFFKHPQWSKDCLKVTFRDDDQEHLLSVR